MAYRPWEEITRKQKIQDYFNGLKGSDAPTIQTPSATYEDYANQLLENTPDGESPNFNWSDFGYQNTFSDTLENWDRISSIGDYIGYGKTGLNALGYLSPALLSGLPTGLGQALTGVGTALQLGGRWGASHAIGQQNEMVNTMQKEGYPTEQDIYNYSPYVNYGLDYPNGDPNHDPNLPTIGNYATDPAMAVSGNAYYNSWGPEGPTIGNNGYAGEGSDPQGADNYTNSWGPQGPSVGNDGYADSFGGGDSGGYGGTVICTELLRQGYISPDFYKAEASYGNTLSIETMNGYRAWAMPIVRWMRKSPTVSGLVRIIASPVLHEMAHRADKAYKTSFIGSVVLSMALPVCSFIGHLKNAVGGLKYA